MKTSIKYKLLPISIIGILVMGIIFGALFVNSQENALSDIYLNDIQSAKKTFYNLEQNDIKLLKAALTDFMTNQMYKDLLVSGDRDALYEASKTLYDKHKELGITHFYYHTADNIVFLRVHKPSQFNDNINRKTYDISRNTNNWGAGLELGATAFALRVVHPYYNNEQLIGYSEYGEEIDHFLEIMKEETGNDYALVVDKEYIDATKWAAIRQANGKRDNYGDLQGHVIIDTTSPQFEDQNIDCWSESSIESASDEGSIFSKIEYNGKSYVCGGFGLYDASNKRVGAVVVIDDITPHEAAAEKTLRDVIILTALLIIIIGALVLFLVTNIIVTPLKKLTETGNKIADGDLEAKFPEIKSKDEIKDLGSTMEMLAGALKFMKAEASKKAEAAKPKTEKKK